MTAHNITMLGTGLIGDFYTNTLHGQRGRDRVRVVVLAERRRGRGVPRALGRSPRRRPTSRPRSTTPTRTSSSSACRTSSTRRRSELVAKAGKAVLCTKPLGRTADEARRILDTVEAAGVFAGYLEDLCYTPKTLKAIGRCEAGADRRRHVGPLPRGPPGTAFGVVLGRPADGRRRDHRPRLPLHRDHPELRRQGEPAGRGDVPHGHARPPDRRRGQRGRPDPVRIRGDRPVRGQLDVPRRDGPARRGRGDARHDLAQPLPADRVRDVLGRARAAATSPRRPRRPPVGCSRSATRCPSWATSTCSATCSGRSTRAPSRGRRSTTATSSTRSWTPVIARRRARRLGAGGARLARRRDAPDRARAGDVRGPGRDQARDPARRPPQAHPQGPGERRLHGSHRDRRLGTPRWPTRSAGSGSSRRC